MADTAARFANRCAATPYSLNVLDNNELFHRLRLGDETAFDEIFRAWYPSLVRTAESIARSRAVAEEIVQDAMLELWRRRESLAHDTAPQAYLFQSTRNRALNYVRHERVERKAEPILTDRSEIDASASAEVVEEEIEVALRRAVAELPERCREVFELSRTSGLKYSEIAAVLGISVKTVEAQMGRALRSLRVKLAQWLPESDNL